MIRERAFPGVACFVAGAVLLALGGCRAPEVVERPFTAPPARIDERACAGDIFGPSPGTGDEPPVPSNPSPAVRARVTLTALERHPGDVLEPISSHARIIAASRRSQPWMAAPRLLAGARIGSGASAAEASAAGGRSAVIGARTADIPAGSTWAVSAGDPTPGPTAPEDGTGWRHMGIFVHLCPGDEGKLGSVRLAVVKEDLAPPERAVDAGDLPPAETAAVPAAGAETPEPAAPPTPEVRREIVVLEDLPPGGQASVLVVVPFGFRGSPGESVAALIEVAEGPPGGAALAQGKEPSAPWPAAAPLPSAPGNGWASIDPTFGVLHSQFHQRRALLFLARRGGSRLGEDAVLSSDDATIARMANRLAKAAEAPPPGADGGPSVASTRSAEGAADDAIGWLVERSCFEELLALSAEGKLPEGLQAVLAIHAGEAGREASVLEETLRGATGREDLARRFTEENRIALEDPAPAARVRAFDWLRARGLAPPGFDPLAPPAERRAILEKVEAAAAEDGAKSAAEGGAR